MPGPRRQAAPGLSPRVRGNRWGRRRSVGAAGSIPSCAGEPRRYSVPARSSGVYPRVCGGTSGPNIRPRAGSGLSPRVRGNPEKRIMGILGRRSIPACAGEPRPGPRAPGARKVYPRVCGGTLCFSRFAGYGGGLSPRVRGNPQAGHQGVGLAVSIPACAGEPPGCRRCPGPRGVYPRVCGGTRCRPHRRGAWPGLSPRVRGNQRAR